MKVHSNAILGPHLAVFSTNGFTDVNTCMPQKLVVVSGRYLMELSKIDQGYSYFSDRFAGRKCTVTAVAVSLFCCFKTGNLSPQTFL